LILISTAIILAIILSIIYPQNFQNPQVIEQYKATTGIVVVFVSGNNWDVALKAFIAKYPNYEIIDHYYSAKRKGYYVKGKLK
jgi:hypothetical protein